MSWVLFNKKRLKLPLFVPIIDYSSSFPGGLPLKKITALVFLFSAVPFLFAQSVSEEELRSVGDRSSEIVFENYVGPTSPDEFNTREEIGGIGSFLASQDGTEVSYGNKYRIVRSFQPEIEEGLDADILFVLEDANVDHIRNLRYIIASYLKSTFGYSDSNAAVLAEFVTYYNAVYYQNLQHFQTRYKEGVVSYLTKTTAGLSTHYSEWAGKSRIVIPLKSGDGAVQSSLDTSTISKPEVVEEMQKEEDRGLDSRKEMVEIREDELDDRQDVVDEEKAAVQEQEKVVEEKAQAVEEKEQAVNEAIAEKQDELAQAEEGSAEEEQIKEELQQLEEEKAAVEEEKAAVEEEKTIVEEAKEKVEEKQEEIDREQKEVAQMREDIAEDVNEMAKEAVVLSSEEPEPVGYWFILVDRSADPAPFGSLVKVTEEGEILQRSELNSIRGTAFVEAADGVIVIAGRNEVNSRVKALILDPETLEIVKESSDEIYPGTGIWTQGDNLFMITRNGQNWSVGQFSKSLELKKLSTVTVHPDTGLVFVDGKILVQSDSGVVNALNADSLAEVITE